MGFREDVRGWISGFIGGYCSGHHVEPVWREPLVGLADARSPLFPELRDIAYPGHRMPQDYLPDAVTVVSYFLPFVPEIPDGNAGGEDPSEAWARAYDLTNGMAAVLNGHIAEKVREMGFDAVVPDDAGQIPGTTYSRWSQRHVARIAGLGSFGMNNMLITSEGCCGRFFSIVTTVPCDHDPPFSGERCLFKLDGSCGLCMDACPVGALSPEGFDRGACDGRCVLNRGKLGASVCGKCQAGMPCTFRDPSR